MRNKSYKVFCMLFSIFNDVMEWKCHNHLESGISSFAQSLKPRHGRTEHWEVGVFAVGYCPTMHVFIAQSVEKTFLNYIPKKAPMTTSKHFMTLSGRLLKIFT